MLSAKTDGAVTLYYDNAVKLATTVSGIDVTGTVTADGLSVATGTDAIINGINGEGLQFQRNGAAQIRIDSVNDDGGVYHAPAGKNHTFKTDGVNRVKFATGGDVQFFEDTGTTPKFYWDASAEALRVGSTSAIFTNSVISGVSALGPTIGAKQTTAAQYAGGFWNADTGAVNLLSFYAGSGGTQIGSIAGTSTGVSLFGSGGNGLTVNSSGNVGIGTDSPAAKLHIENGDMRIEKDTKATIGFRAHTTGSTALAFRDSSAAIDRMTIDASGNVGISTSSPPEGFAIGATSSVAGFSIGSGDTQVFLRYNNYFSGTAQVSDATKGSASLSLGRGSDGVITFNTAAAGAGAPSEAMRIDASGNLLVGKTTPSSATAGHELLDYGRAIHTANATTVQIVNRLGNDGDISIFQKDGTTAGSIGNVGSIMYIGKSDTTIAFDETSDSVKPRGTAGAQRDGAINLGTAGNRWKDLYLSGQILSADGTAGAPAYAFGNDTDMGMYRAANNNLGLSTNGAERMRIDASGNVGINQADPQTKTHITAAGSGSGVTDVLTIQTTRSDVGTAFAGGAINFVNNDTNSAGQARIKVGSSNDVATIGLNSESAQSFIFETSTSGSATTSNIDGNATTITVTHETYSGFVPGQRIAINTGTYQGGYFIDTVTSDTEFTIADTDHDLAADSSGTPTIQYAVPRDSMIIRADGNVGVGTSSPDAKLEISGFSTGAGLKLNYGNSSGTIEAVNFEANGGANGVIGMQMVSAGVGDLWLGGSGGRSLTLYRDGNVGIGTDSPTFKLHVQDDSSGDATFQGGILVENTGTTTGEPALAFKNQDTGSNYWFTGLNQDTNYALNYGTDFTDGFNLFTLTSGGNLGVGGDPDPDERLVVTGSANNSSTAIVVQNEYSLASSVNESTDLQFRFYNAGSTSFSSGAMIRSTKTEDWMTTATASASLNLFTRYNNTLARRIVISDIGKMIIGTQASPRANYGSTQSPQLQIEGTNSETGAIGVVRNSADSNPSYLYLGKTRSATNGVSAPTIVQDNDLIGSVVFTASDGAVLQNAARISGIVDGTPTAGTVPGELLFYVGDNGTDLAFRIEASSNATFAGDITTTGIQMGSGTANDIQANGKTAFFGSAIFGDSAATNTPLAPVHIKGAGAPSLRIEDLDSTNQIYDFISNQGVGLSIVDLTASITPLAFAHTTGNATFAGDVTVTGDLFVTGATTSVNVEDLNVEQGEITLNFGAGDTSAAANGAGIRIQDAVDASTDATILWNATSDKFEFSHGIISAGPITGSNLSGTNTGDETQSSINALGITEVGTITTGVWNGDIIAEAYLQNQSGTNTGDETQSSINALGITEVGTIATGVWNGDIIAEAYLQNQSGTNTGDETQASINALGITEVGTIATGTWNGDIIAEAYLQNQSGTNTGDETQASINALGITEVGTIATGVWNGDIIAEAYLQNQSGTNTGDEPAASTTVAGIVELATTAETTTGTDATRAVTPDGLKDGYQGSSNVTTLGTIATGTWNGDIIAEAYLQNQSGTNTGDETQASINALGITEVGTIATGTWNGDIIAEAYLQNQSGTNTGDETQSSINALGITEVGTITTGVWNGDIIAEAYLQNQSGTNTGDETQASINALGITEVGTIATGTWNGDIIAEAYLQNQSGTNTGDETQASINALGITEVGTITTGVWNGDIIAEAYLQNQSGTNTGDETQSSINALGITEVGTIATGVWNGDIIAEAYLQNQSGTNTGDETQASINALGITEVGTIATGTWNGSAIASAYLDADTAHLSGTQTFTGQKNFNSSGGTIPLNISRSGSNANQVLSIGVTDTTAEFNYIEDTDAEGTGAYGSYVFKVSGNEVTSPTTTVLTLDENQAKFAGTIYTRGAGSLTPDATQPGAIILAKGGSEASPSTDGRGIEFLTADANDGYGHRLVSFDNTNGDTPLILQRRNNNAAWTTQVTFEGNSNNTTFAGSISASEQSVFSGGITSTGESHLYKAGTNNVQTVVAVIGSDSTRPTLVFSESAATTINAGMSLEYNGQGSGDTNFMTINSVDGASKFQFTSGGDFKIGSTTVIDSSRNLTNIGTISSGALTVTGAITATGDITAYFSDERFKTKTRNIENPLEKVQALSGFMFVENELARSLGYKNDKEQVALSAQEVQAVLPEAVSLAPIDMKTNQETGEITSKSGENYLTVDYAKLVPLLVEAIKELKDEVDELKKRIK